MIQRRNRTHAAGRKRAVIFDFDGTIADSLHAIVQVFEDLTGRPGYYTEEQISSFRDLHLPELIKALEVPKWKVPILMFRGRRMLRAHMHGIAVHAGVADMLEYLHGKGVPLYILSSNSTENVQKYLQWHKLSHCFAGVYGGVSLLGKAPRLAKLIETENLSLPGSWYVGDETRDIAAARSVGLHIASVTWGYNTRTTLEQKAPDAVVDTAKDLQAALGGLWKK